MSGRYHLDPARMPLMPPGKGDKSCAYKVLSGCSWLTGTDKAVGAYLVDCCNHETGACFPSQQKIADRIGASSRSVERSIKKLCSPVGQAPALFEKVQDAVNSRSNAYAINWEAFRELEKMHFKPVRANRFRSEVTEHPTEMSGDTRQECRSKPDKTVGQTQSINPEKEPIRGLKPVSGLVGAVMGRINEDQHNKAKKAIYKRFCDRGEPQRKWLSSMWSSDEFHEAAAMEARKPNAGYRHMLSVYNAQFLGSG